MECLIREMIEIKLHPDSMNRKGGFFLSRLWRPSMES
jgi:hypothetical protein